MQALRERRGTIQDAWHVVLYMCCFSEASLVSAQQRELCQWQREIALMAQGMKLPMHALRRTACRRISTRPRCSAAAHTSIDELLS